MSALASAVLEEAIFATLKNDSELISLLGGSKIFDEPKRNASFPYLTLVTSYSRDWSTGTELGDEHRLVLTLWTGSHDRALQRDIMARLQQLLRSFQPALSEHILVNIQIERLEMRPDRKNHLLQGVMQVRAVTEHRLD